ncbi:MAG: alpha/beta hydrolase [Cyclobacteriaceae bacterium]|nr:alpha/beta hydrolase [Cyclobacteriaceae bacterium]
MKKLARISLLLSALLLLVGVAAYFIVGVTQETQALNAEVRQKAPGNFIKLPGGLTHYQLLGPHNGRPVVLLHGGGVAGMEVWKQNTMYFAEQSFRVLAYDLFGRGYSDRAEQEYTPEGLLNQFTALVDSVGLEKPFTIISMSMGSMVALDYAARYPNRVDKLIMIDPAITGDFKANAALKVPVVSSLLLTLYWYPRAVENQRKEFTDHRVFDAYAQRLAYFMNFEGYKTMNYLTWMHTLNQSRVELLDDFPADKILLIYGNQDPYFPEANVQKFLKRYPTLQAHEIYGAGHMPQLERPKEVNELILGYLLEQELYTTPPQEIRMPE